MPISRIVQEPKTPVASVRRESSWQCFFAGDLGRKSFIILWGDLMGKFKFNLSVWEEGGISNLVVVHGMTT